MACVSEAVPCCLCALCILSCLPRVFGTAGGHLARALQHLPERALEAGRPGKAHRTALPLGRPLYAHRAAQADLICFWILQDEDGTLSLNDFMIW